MDQLSFLEAQERTLLQSPTAAVRYVPNVFSAQESCEYFAFLMENVNWEATSMWMYDRTVTVPRLVSHYGMGERLPEEVLSMQLRLEERTGATYNAVGMNLYRDGRDSVAWHSDHNEDLLPNPTVAVLSFGTARPMMLRSKTPPRHAISVDLEPGSALLMTGDAQELFEHQIPKLGHDTGPRISVVFRTKVLK